MVTVRIIHTFEVDEPDYIENTGRWTVVVAVEMPTIVLIYSYI